MNTLYFESVHTQSEKYVGPSLRLMPIITCPLYVCSNFFTFFYKDNQSESVKNIGSSVLRCIVGEIHRAVEKLVRYNDVYVVTMSVASNFFYTVKCIRQNQDLEFRMLYRCDRCEWDTL